MYTSVHLVPGNRRHGLHQPHVFISDFMKFISDILTTPNLWEYPRGNLDLHTSRHQSVYEGKTYPSCENCKNK